MTEWFKASKKPPKTNHGVSDYVLITDGHTVGIGIYNFDTKEWFPISPSLLRVAYWAYLPEPPK